MKRLKADIVVIAAGTAGLPAAVTAAEGGASVVVLEKMGRTGGAANRGNMIFAVESQVQRETSPVVITKEEAYKVHMEWTHWRVDARLVSDFFNKSASTIDWLAGMGVEFQPMNRPMGPYNTAHVIKGEPPGPKAVGQAAAMAKILTKRAEELGAKIYLKTPAKSLIKRKGRIVGVVAEDKSGEEIRVAAKAVIIATGGFSGNKEWMEKYTGYKEGEDLFGLHKAGVVGDGLRMAWEVGAAPTPMYIELTHHLPPPCHGPGGAAIAFNPITRPQNIMVNLLGERFVGEDLGGSHAVIANALGQQKGKSGFMILDGDLKKFYDENPLNYAAAGAMPYQRFKHDNMDDNIKEAQGQGYKYLYMADSLEDLCAQTGINLDGLRKTIEEYNQACAIGRDDIFHKDAQYLRPFKGVPRFYAGRFFPGSYGTAGGIKINYKTEVLTRDFDVIPGLYAAGNDANNIYEASYTPLAGNYIGFAVNTGRIAAEHALEYIKSV